MAHRTGPLEGVEVLDLSRLYPGAFLTSLLADLGADVVKVEAPGTGDMLRVLTPEPFKAGHVALARMFGTSTLGFDPRTASSSNCILVWGANPSATAPLSARPRGSSAWSTPRGSC